MYAHKMKVEYAFLMIKVSENPNVPDLCWGTLRWDGITLQQGWNPYVLKMAALRGVKKDHSVVTARTMMSTIQTLLKDGVSLKDVILRDEQNSLRWTNIQEIEDGSDHDQHLQQRLGIQAKM